MPVHNKDIIRVLETVADLLDIQKENQFRTRAYRQAAQTINSLPDSVTEMIDKGEDLTRLSGIGEDLAGKIKTIAQTGSLPLLEELQEQIPPSLQELLRIPGLGPRGVKVIYDALGVTDLQGLKKAAEQDLLQDLEGFGEKTQKKILEEIKKNNSHEDRMLFRDAQAISRTLLDYLKKLDGVKKVAAAGSLRRKKETVGDLDILLSCKRGTDAMGHLLDYEDVEKVVVQGKTKTSVVLRSGLQVDLRVVAHASYGSALLYFTGSKAHGIKLRKRGMERELKINEYGVYKNKKKVAGKTEHQIYKNLGLPFIPPELREDRGEIEAAEKDQLPKLVQRRDIKGDLHVHTKKTDGHQSIEEMAREAEKLGYEYLAITEHSKRVTVAGGLDAEELEKHIRDIEKVNQGMDNIEILTGAEVDILEDGSLDLPDEILSRLDVVIGSVHYKFNLSRKKQTRRIVTAMENPYFMILGHPTGRKINQREPMDLDLDDIFSAAKDNGCFLELNAFYDRLDLTDIACIQAAKKKVGVVINTDAHRTPHMDYMDFGVAQARRGWLEAKDVLNTRSLKQLRKCLKGR
ncbi:MAG TPA: DNA polymerase/3'-5' exonuclease PolX [Desulfotignum sp.]|nr:DNA polymerase/3'-5' exonuclease PolX [Desulfotignum sp.]